MTLPLDPLGTISLAEENLRTMLSASTAFQTFCGIDPLGDQPAAEALARIYRDGLPGPADDTSYTLAELQALRPYAVIFTADAHGLLLERDAAEQFEASGHIHVRLQRDCPSTYDDEPTSDANRDFKNFLGQIMNDLCSLRGQAASGQLMFDRLSLDYGPYWPTPQAAEAQGYWQGADLSVRWRGLP